MSKPNASPPGFQKGRFNLALAAAVLGAAALTLATPPPASADERGRWEQSGNRNGKGKYENHGRRQGQWNGQRGGERGSGGSWGGQRYDYRGGGKGGGYHGGGDCDRDDDHHHGGSRHHSYGGPKWKHHHRDHVYSYPVYVPTPAYGYAPAYFCNPCAHAFASYDDLYQHVAWAHSVPVYEVPNLVVQVGVNWVFGF